jgi:uncharacterized membrane protein
MDEDLTKNDAPGSAPQIRPAGHIAYNEIAGQKTVRIEAISDGVFAVALTLLVLDIKVPEGLSIKTEHELFNSFCTLTPKFLTWFLSFMTLGIFWTGHSAQYIYIEKSDRHLNWISLFFLLFVSILPFTTAFLSAYIQFKLAVVLYWLNILALGAALYLHWGYAQAHGFVKLPQDKLPAISRAIKQRIVTAQTLYALGAALSFINTYLSVGVIIVIQLNYATAIGFRKKRKFTAY